MIFRALDPVGDWSFGRGVQSYVRDEDAVEINVETRLKSFLGDAFWAVDFGIDWWNLLGSMNPKAQAAIVLATRLTIAESYGVVRINSVEAETDRATRNLRLAYEISTIFNRSGGSDVPTEVVIPIVLRALDDEATLRETDTGTLRTVGSI